MALSMNWATRVVTIPQADLALVSGSLYELDTNVFRLGLKAIEASEDGMPFPDAHRHNTIVTVAGVTFARLIEIINTYAVAFEAGAYSVRLAGSNNNLFDVESGVLQQNTVQVIAQNSAGLVVVAGGAGASASEVWQRVIEAGSSPGAQTAEELLRIIAAAAAGLLAGAVPSGPTTMTMTAAGGSKPRIVADVDGVGNRTDVVLDGTP